MSAPKRGKRRTLKTVCKDCQTDVMHWVHYAAAGDIPTFPPGLEDTLPDWEINRRIFIHDGSITELECDVIVVSASKQLAPKGMPSVYKQAGPELTKAAKKQAPKQITDVVETDAYALPADHVFHVVTPANAESASSLEELEKCYKNCLNLMAQKGYRSIALPCLGSGGPMITKDTAGNIALRTVRQWMEENKAQVYVIESIIFCLFVEQDRDIYGNYMHKWFPTGQNEEEKKNSDNEVPEKKKGKKKK